MNSDDAKLSLDELINKYKSLKYNDAKTKVILTVSNAHVLKFNFFILQIDSL